MCSERKLCAEFPVRRSSKSGLGSYCKNCHRRLNRAFKMKLWAALGGPSCARCSESGLDFLTLEHKNGGGKLHRMEASSWRSIYKEIIRDMESRSLYEVLCMNCNAAKSFETLERSRSGTKKSILHHGQRVRLKAEALRIVHGSQSPTCTCCGHGVVAELCLDHVIPYSQDPVGPRGFKMYGWVVEYPDDAKAHLQVLCFNCNQSKGVGLSCAHQRPDSPLIPLH